MRKKTTHRSRNRRDARACDRSGQPRNLGLRGRLSPVFSTADTQPVVLLWGGLQLSLLQYEKEGNVLCAHIRGSSVKKEPDRDGRASPDDVGGLLGDGHVVRLLGHQTMSADCSAIATLYVCLSRFPYGISKSYDPGPGVLSGSWPLCATLNRSAVVPPSMRFGPGLLGTMCDGSSYAPGPMASRVDATTPSAAKRSFGPEESFATPLASLHLVDVSYAPGGGTFDANLAGASVSKRFVCEQKLDDALAASRPSTRPLGAPPAPPCARSGTPPTMLPARSVSGAPSG